MIFLSKTTLFTFLTAVSVLGFLPCLSEAQVCQMSGADQFKSKNGLITFDFSMHRGPDELAVFDSIMNRNTPLTTAEVEQFKSWIQKRGAMLNLRDQLQRVVQLKSLIKNGQIDWIGIEYSPSEISDKDEKGREGLARFNFLKKKLETAGVSPHVMEEALLLFAGSPARYVWYSEQTVRQRVRLAPLDSDSIKATGQRMLADVITNADILELALKHFGAKDNERQVLFGKLSEAARSQDNGSIVSLATNLSKVGDLMQVIRIVYNEDKSLNDFLTRYIRDKRIFDDNQKARDRYVARESVSQVGNGWISFGESHAENLKRQIEHSCRSLELNPSQRLQANPPLGTR